MRDCSGRRVLTNFIGNALATVVVAKWCGALDAAKMSLVLNDETADEADLPEAILDDRRAQMDTSVARPALAHH